MTNILGIIGATAGFIGCVLSCAINEPMWAILNFLMMMVNILLLKEE